MKKNTEKNITKKKKTSSVQKKIFKKKSEKEI